MVLPPKDIVPSKLFETEILEAADPVAVTFFSKWLLLAPELIDKPPPRLTFPWKSFKFELSVVPVRLRVPVPVVARALAKMFEPPAIVMSPAVQKFVELAQV